MARADRFDNTPKCERDRFTCCTYSTLPGISILPCYVTDNFVVAVVFRITSFLFETSCSERKIASVPRNGTKKHQDRLLRAPPPNLENRDARLGNNHSRQNIDDE